MSGPLARSFSQQAIAQVGAEFSALWTVTVLLAAGMLISSAAARRAMAQDAQQGMAFGIAAVTVAPVTTLMLHQFWFPATVLTPYLWALHVMAVAALMVVFALRFARWDGTDHRRVAYATIAALSLIALSLFVLITAAALTLALAALVLATAALDRRFDLPELGWFVTLGVAVLGWRVVVDPGLGWAFGAPLPEVILAFVGVIGALLGAALLVAPMNRPGSKGVLESAVAGFAALFVNVMIARWLGQTRIDDLPDSAVALTLNAMPWLILMLVQIYRMPLGGPLRPLRGAMAIGAGLLAALGLAAAVGPFNPLFAGQGDPGALVRGPWLFDTLLVAYGLPGLLLLAAAARLPGLDLTVRRGFLAVGAALAAIYIGLEIRRFWQGDFLGSGTVTQPELYSYTVAMMLLGAVLLYQAIARRSSLLRRVAMTVIAVTVAKVFLIDAAGLTGLTRVASFLLLGLSLAGLAWLNRWAGAGDGDRRDAFSDPER